MWIIAVVVIVALILLFSKGKKKEECINCDEPVCAELSKLVVYHKGKVVQAGSVIKIANNVKYEFSVLGYDVTGTKDACIKGEDVTWGKSCPCTYWDNVNGLVNNVLTNNKTLNTPRVVWVKHNNGLELKWKVEVI